VRLPKSPNLGPEESYGNGVPRTGDAIFLGFNLKTIQNMKLFASLPLHLGQHCPSYQRSQCTTSLSGLRLEPPNVSSPDG
jgi:hypothetical protein